MNHTCEKSEEGEEISCYHNGLDSCTISLNVSPSYFATVGLLICSSLSVGRIYVRRDRWVVRYYMCDIVVSTHHTLPAANGNELDIELTQKQVKICEEMNSFFTD